MCESIESWMKLVDSVPCIVILHKLGEATYALDIHGAFLSQKIKERIRNNLPVWRCQIGHPSEWYYAEMASDAFHMAYAKYLLRHGAFNEDKEDADHGSEDAQAGTTIPPP